MDALNEKTNGQVDIPESQTGKGEIKINRRLSLPELKPRGESLLAKYL
jgi:hypothetical protein